MTLTKQTILNAFYQKNGQYFTNILSIIDDEANMDKVYETVIELLDENEIRFVLEDEPTDLAAAFILYRNTNRLLMAYVFNEDDHFVLDLEGCMWEYPDFVPLKPKEIEVLGTALDAYIKEEEIPLTIQSRSPLPLQVVG